MKKYIKFIGLVCMVLILSTSVYAQYDGPELRAEAINSINEITKIEMIDTYFDESIIEDYQI